MDEGTIVNEDISVKADKMDIEKEEPKMKKRIKRQPLRGLAVKNIYKMIFSILIDHRNHKTK